MQRAQGPASAENSGSWLTVALADLVACGVWVGQAMWLQQRLGGKPCPRKKDWLAASEPTHPQQDVPATGLQRQLCLLSDSPTASGQNPHHSATSRTWHSPWAGPDTVCPPAGFSGSFVSEPIKCTCSQNCILSVCLLTPPLRGQGAEGKEGGSVGWPHLGHMA